MQHITAGRKMQEGKAYLELNSQVTAIIYRNSCADYRLEVPGSRWATAPKVIENNQAKILWAFLDPA